MLNRRHLRVKVLQALYAYEQSSVKEINSCRKQLLEQVDNVYEMYVFILSLMVEVVKFADTDSLEKSSRHIPIKYSHEINARFVANSVTALIENSIDFKNLHDNYHIDLLIDKEIVRSIFKELKESEAFETYGTLVVQTFEQDKELSLFLFKKIITKNVLLGEFLEGRNISWTVDKDVVESMVTKTLKNMKAGNLQLLDITSNWEEDKQYILDLFMKTIENDPIYQSFIAEKTQNWEIDRIALIDTILMKMAICELLNFPSIPIKVSINEYIDISKEFSTPKSKIFINGILDKILLDFKNENKINKTGRGLLE